MTQFVRVDQQAFFTGQQLGDGAFSAAYPASDA
jgi:hypothetical protein